MKKWSRHLLAAGALAIGMSAAHADDSKTPPLLITGPNMPPGLLEQFTKETGIWRLSFDLRVERNHVRQAQTYKDGAYDLVVPSTYFVDKMRKKACCRRSIREAD